jgi:hypothetical protein
VTNLEQAARLEPETAEIHQELSAADRRAERQQDAERELAVYETLKAGKRDPSIIQRP